MDPIAIPRQARQGRILIADDDFDLMAKLAGVIPARQPGADPHAHRQSQHRDEAACTGRRGVGFLTKPFDVTEVLLRIRHLLATRFLHLETMAHNRILDATVKQRTQNLEDARLDVLARLARAAEFRDGPYNVLDVSDRQG